MPGVSTKVNGHTVSEVVDALRRADCDPQKNGNGWKARCPAHNDRNPSLTVDHGDSADLVLRCHAGCGFMDIITALFPAVSSNAARSARMRNVPRKVITPTLDTATVTRRITATYDYTDAAGVLLFQGVRYEPKDFRQRRPDGSGGWLWNLTGTTRVLYQLPHLATAGAEAFIYLVEGEKDADRLRDQGLFATTSPAGAGKFHLADATPLHGHHVVVIADNDAPGRKHAEQVAALLHGKAASVRVLHLAGLARHGDVSDWLDAGHDSDDLDTLAVGTPQWEPPTAATAAATTTETDTRLVTVCMSDVPRERTRWLWHNRFPCKVSIIAGNPGLGKTTVALDMAARISCGMSWPDTPDTPNPVGSVILMTLEDGLGDTIRPRLEAMDADLAKIHAVKHVEDVDQSGQRIFNVEDDALLLENKIRQLGDVRMVIVDPLQGYMGGQRDTYRDNEVRAALAPLAAVADRQRVAIIGIMHLRKSSSDHALFRVLGSVAFTAFSRAVWAVAEDRDDTDVRVMLPFKVSQAKAAPGLRFQIIDPGKVEWMGETTMTADEAFAPVDPDEAGPKVREAMEWLEAALHDGAVRVKEVQRGARENCIASRTLDRAKIRLGVVSTNTGIPINTWFWSLPETPTTEDGTGEYPAESAA